MRTLIRISKIIILTTLIVFGTLLIAQEDAPNQPEAFEPFTQSDLSVLTGNVQRPNGFTWFNDNIYAVCNGDWTLYEIQDTTGDTRTFIQGVRNAHALYPESSETASLNLWIPDYDTNSLLLVNPSRAPQIIAPNLEGPWGIDALNDEHFVVTNLTGNNIITINRNGEIIQTLNELRSPTGIAVDEEYIYFANNGSARRALEWLDREDFENGESTPQPLVSGLQNVTGVIMGDDNYLYFTYALGTRGVVGRINPEICIENGGCTNDQIDVVVFTELSAPLAGLTITPDMRMFFHTIYRPEIYWLQLETLSEIEEDNVG
ncbi:MAG: hypothetical protein RLP44_03160 [Aggregatilineales bacterium]